MAITLSHGQSAASAVSTLKKLHHRIVIIGGGTAGITLAARLARAGQTDMAIIEPSRTHFYQPMWTLVAGGVVGANTTARPEERYVPRNVHWVQDYAQEIDPENKLVTTRGGSVIGYDFLVVAPGIQLDWHKVEGLAETLGKNMVTSNYRFDLAPKTWEFLQQFKGGTALFTAPGTPIKCGGAPQKAMYLSADYLRRKGILKDTKVIFGSAGTTLFGTPEVRKVLEGVVARYGIEPRFFRELVAVDPVKKEAIFELKNDPARSREVIPFDFLHVVPPQSAPDFLKNGPLAVPGDALGWVDVDINTLQHKRYPDVFALGDCANLPTAKTGAAVRKQAPVVVQNLLSVMSGTTPQAKYNGYSSCPLVTGYGKLQLAEFIYGTPNEWHPTIPLIDTKKERYDMWLLKRYGLPFLYWNLMLRGLV